MNHFPHCLPNSVVGTDIQTALSESLETKFRDAFKQMHIYHAFVLSEIERQTWNPWMVFA